MSKKSKRLSSGIERIKTIRSLKNSKNRAAISKSSASTNPDRKLRENKKNGFYRTKNTINRLNMYNEKGKLASNDRPSGTMVRVEPDRKWFGNTRVITQNKLETFREEVSKASSDPFSVVLKRSKLPNSLLDNNDNHLERSIHEKVNLLNIEPYNRTFGQGHKRRKKPKIVFQFDNLSDLANKIEKTHNNYSQEQSNSSEYNDFHHDKTEEKREFNGFELINDDSVLKKGTSRRIWQELYKVIDSSDIIIHVLDSRDPEGTRCKYLEEYISKECKHKYILFVLNKVDLIPKWVVSKWIALFGSIRPTIAFHSSITNSFGKRTLFHVLRQYASLLSDKKHISVGFIGYPNVGKSSIINTLRGSKVCKVAPIAGETKIWQYIHLTHRIYLIDCPGIVPPENASSYNVVLRGAVRPEKLSDPCIYIKQLLNIVKERHIKEKYNLKNTDNWNNSDEFLTLVGKRLGKVLRGGEIDLITTAKIIINDWIVGKIPYFIPPPQTSLEIVTQKNGDKDLIDLKAQDIERINVCKEFECYNEYPNDLEKKSSSQKIICTEQFNKWDDVICQFD
ncbi:YjeQ GTPase [Cryptosporidium ubiquitum]|uniref:Nucleolar GTP-binding protein 2 n=1 Tax=Cryptosporidium ubiquitum TaxID=857276 RepID=A0A1J4ME98_9CRYT|nr:YjeQ GTPase [Cryptosporidium ubiquitum]OII71787.1 YjeQ GTPase [Cryptosporidium ubiquitum]